MLFPAPEAPQRNSIVSWFLPKSAMLVALPVDDQTLRADGPYGARVAFSPVAGRRDGCLRRGRRDAPVLEGVQPEAEAARTGGGTAGAAGDGHSLMRPADSERVFGFTFFTHDKH